MAATPWRGALGERVRATRVERGWSMRMVSMKSRVPESTWRRLEAGEAVSDAALIGVSDALGWPQGQCFRIIANELDDAERRGD